MLLRAVLFAPLAIFICLSVAFVVALSGGVDRGVLSPAVIISGALAVYFYVGVLMAAAFHLKPERRLLAGIALPAALFLILAVVDLIQGPPPASFFPVDYKGLGFLPGMILAEWVGDIKIDTTPSGPRIVSSERVVVHVQHAISQPDGSVILGGTVFRINRGIEWRLVGRLDRDGKVDTGFSPKKVKLPLLDALRPAANGTALITWRPGEVAEYHVDSLDPSGALRPLLPTANSDLQSIGGITDVLRDAQGRFLLTGSFQKATSPPSYQPQSYPIVRMKDGKMDPSFALLGLDTFQSGRILRASNEGIWFTYYLNPAHLTLRHLLPDGKLDAAFDRAWNGRSAQDAAIDGEGRILVLTREGALSRFNADGAERRGETVQMPVSVGPEASVMSLSDGSILLVVGNRPVLLRYNDGLHPDGAFNPAVASLARDADELHVLAAREDGSLVLGLFEHDKRSRVLYVDRSGKVMTEVTF